MESSSFQGFPLRMSASTLESDDVYDAYSHSNLSCRYDSGIDSLTDFSRLSSIASTFGSIPRTLDGAMNLEETFDRLSMLEKCETNGGRCVAMDGFPVEKKRLFQAEHIDVMPTVSGRMENYPFPVSNDLDPRFQAVDPFIQDEDGDTQLHLSIIQPNPSFSIRLIEAGQFTDRLDIQNDHQQTPLHLAVITDQPQLVRALVVSGASLFARDKQGNVPLHLACKLGHAQCVDRLMTPPSEVEEQYISRERQKRGLAPKGMTYMRPNDANILNYEGDTCLHLALSSVVDAKFPILDYLLNTCGLDVNAQEGKCGFTLLHQAVRSRDLEAVHFLLAQKEVFVNLCCYNGYSPLDFAISQRHPILIDLLRHYGALSFLGASGSEAETFQDDDFDDLIIGGRHPEAGSLRR